MGRKKTFWLFVLLVGSSGRICRYLTRLFYSINLSASLWKAAEEWRKEGKERDEDTF